MEKVQYSEFSKSYSRIVAGVMRWGLWGAKFSKSAYQKMIAACVEQGISSFDHADIYGDYTTEGEFGFAFGEMDIARERVQLITKCGIRMKCDNRPANKLASYDHSKSFIIQQVEQSLQNLKTDYIDLLLIHRPSPLMHAEEVASAFTELKTAGKVLDFGVSNFTTTQFNLLYSYFPLVTNQLELSPVMLDSFSDGVLDNLQQHKIKPQAWSPLAGAQLFAHQARMDDTERIMRLQAVCRTYGWSLAEMAYLFLLHHPACISPVLGTSKAERLTEAVSALTKKITDEQWFEIWTASKGERVP